MEKYPNNRSFAVRNDSPFIQSLVDDALSRGLEEIVIPAVNPIDGTSVYGIGEPIVLGNGANVILDNCTLNVCLGALTNVFISEGAFGEQAPVELNDVSISGRGRAVIDGGGRYTVSDKAEEAARVRAGGRFDPALLGSVIFMRNVEGFRISNIAIRTPRRGITLEFCGNGTVSDIIFEGGLEPADDGVELRLGCHDILVDRIRGCTCASTVTLAAAARDGFFAVGDKSRDIVGVTINDVRTYSVSGLGTIALRAGGGRVHDVAISDIADTSCGVNSPAAVRVGEVLDPEADGTLAEGDIDAISVDGLESGSEAAIRIFAPTVTKKNISFKRIKCARGVPVYPSVSDKK